MSVCDFHGPDSPCMDNGALYVAQTAPEGPPVILAMVCTLSAVSAWCLKHEAIDGARPGDLKAKRPGSRQHADQRPTVATRRPRRSLAPGGET